MSPPPFYSEDTVYRTINGWTKERMIAQIQAKVPKNGGYSGNNRSNCAYRTQSGGACAVGAFIPDVAYSPAMENHGVTYIQHYFPHVIKHMPVALEGLREMQKIHDGSTINGRDVVGELIEWIEANVSDVEGVAFDPVMNAETDMKAAFEKAVQALKPLPLYSPGLPPTLPRFQFKVWDAVDMPPPLRELADAE
jgi:hypothetical protein